MDELKGESIVMIRRIKPTFTAISLFIILCFLAVWLKFLFTPLITDPAGIHYQLAPGTSLHAFSDDLHRRGILRHPIYFNLLARLHNSAHELKAGVYLFPVGMTPSALLAEVTSGRGLVFQVFTIIPGWNFLQLRMALNHNPHLEHNLLHLSDQELMQTLGAPVPSPEGQFFPDSYYFTEGSSDLKLLKRAYERMQSKLQKAWSARLEDTPFLNPYQALIAASLVEREAALSAERPVIAGVLINRLQRKMPLQFDPTIVYSLGPRFNGTLDKKDLTFDTPYNTYLHHGLPPTPIAIPSLDALNAVLHPVQHAYFYFVAKSNGSHQFSKTLEEHHIAVSMLRRHDDGFFNYELLQHYLSISLTAKENT